MKGTSLGHTACSSRTCRRVTVIKVVAGGKRTGSDFKGGAGYELLRRGDPCMRSDAIS